MLIYKIVVKTLANHLKVLLPAIISPAQSAFVPNRMITNNVMIAFELIHFMKRKTRGKRREVALKVDISKAYDEVDWEFLKLVMLKMGFASH